MSKQSTTNQGQRTVGLDKPCQSCGRPIYYNYKGPIDGLCGRCADRKTRKPARRTLRRPLIVKRHRPAVKTGVLVLVGILAGLVAMYLILNG